MIDQTTPPTSDEVRGLLVRLASSLTSGDIPLDAEVIIGNALALLTQKEAEIERLKGAIRELKIEIREMQRGSIDWKEATQ